MSDYDNEEDAIEVDTSLPSFIKEVKFKDLSYFKQYGSTFCELSCDLKFPGRNWVSMKLYFPQNEIFAHGSSMTISDLKKLANPKADGIDKHNTIVSIMHMIIYTIGENGIDHIASGNAGNISLIAMEGSSSGSHWIGATGGVDTPVMYHGSMRGIIDDFLFAESYEVEEDNWTNTLIMMSCNIKGTLINHPNVDLLFNRGRVGLLSAASGESNPIRWDRQGKRFINLDTGDEIDAAES